MKIFLEKFCLVLLFFCFFLFFNFLLDNVDAASDPYALPLSYPDEEGDTVYRAYNVKTKRLFKTFPKNHYNSVWELFLSSVEEHSDKEFLGRRRYCGLNCYDEYIWSTFYETYNDATLLGSALITKNKGVDISQIKNGNEIISAKFVGIWATNSPKWFITLLATHGYGLVSASYYDTLSARKVIPLMKKIGLSTIFIDSAKFKDLKYLVNSVPTLKTIISYDPIPNMFEDIEGVDLIFWDDFIASTKLLPEKPSKNDELTSIIYTSGTTGDYKEVMFTENNILYMLEGIFQSGLVERKKLYTVLSFLPLSHIAERTMEYCILATGGRIGYYHGNKTEVMDDLQTLKPNVLLGVPILFEKFVRKIEEKVAKSNIFKRMFFNSVLGVKKLFRKVFNTHKSIGFDKIAMKEIKKATGGNVEIVISGASMINSNIIEIVSAMLNVPMVQMWGMSEVGVVIGQRRNDFNEKSIGGIFPSAEFKIIPVLGTNYTAKGKNPIGELCIRGPTVMKGYLGDTEKTKNAINSYGWLYTGDIVQLLDNYALTIKDRIKNIFKLSQGEYVAPEKLETAYKRSHFIDQIFVYGDSSKPFLVAMISPNESGVLSWAAERNLEYLPYKDLLKNADLLKEIKKDLDKIHKENHFNGLEKIHKFALIDKIMLTPSMKIRRKEMETVYAEQLKNLYLS